MTWLTAAQIVSLAGYAALTAAVMPGSGRRLRSRLAAASLFSLDASRSLQMRIARRDLWSALAALATTAALMTATVRSFRFDSPLLLAEFAAATPALVMVWRAMTTISVVRYIDPREALVRAVYGALTLDAPMPHQVIPAVDRTAS